MDTSFRTIYVENFALGTSQKLLERLFNYFGPIKHIDLPTFEPEHPLCRGLPKPKSKGFAFVEFKQKEAADKACQFFNDLDYIKMVAQLQRDGTLSTPECDIQASQNTMDRMKIIQNLEFRNLLLLRVLPKRKFQELSRGYNEKKLQTLVGAAKLLIVA